MKLDQPVKTYLMAAFQTAITNAAIIKLAKYGHPIAIDMDTAIFPYAFFFDGEESKKDRNRITEKTFDLYIQTYVTSSPAQQLFDQMDVIDAGLETTVLNDPTIRSYALLVIPVSSSKHLVFDESSNFLGLGYVETVFRVTYAHAWKDPFELPKNPS
jgi:hypothetical protein